MPGDAYMEKIRERVREHPDSKLFLSLAEELRIRGEREEAIAVLKEGIERIPGFIPARLTLARWYYWDGRFTDAQHECKVILEHSPEHAFARRYLNEIEAKFSAARKDQSGPGGARVERLRRFLEAVQQRFPTGESGRAGA